MLRVTLVALVAVSLSGCASGADPASPSVAAVVEATEMVRVPEEAQATDAIFAEFTEDTPGCAVAVRRGDDVFADGYGMADLDTGRPITTNTVFDVASVSKQITAGTVLALVAQGDLDLGDDITDWLPDLDVTPGAVTVGDLVHHTSGLPDYTELIDAEVTEVTTAQDALDTLAGVDAIAPGTGFEYNNTNYFLLGQIVEAVSGRTLVEDARTRVFTPLDMTRTTYRDDQGTFTSDQAIGYADTGHDEYARAVSAWQQTGDGAVHTTITDLMRWANLFIDEPQPEGVGSSDWLDLMLEPGPIPDEDGSSYGGGIGLYEVDGSSVLDHSGSWIGVASHLQVRPDDDLAIALACNIDGLDTDSLVDALVAAWTEG